MCISDRAGAKRRACPVYQFDKQLLAVSGHRGSRGR